MRARACVRVCVCVSVCVLLLSLIMAKSRQKRKNHSARTVTFSYLNSSLTHILHEQFDAVDVVVGGSNVQSRELSLMQHVHVTRVT